MKKLYIFLHFIAITLLIFAVLGVFALSDSHVVSFLAKKYLKEFHVSYSHVSGSLLSGVTISDVEYGDFFKAKEIEVDYGVLGLLRPTPQISAINVDSLELNTQKLPKSDANATAMSVMAFVIKNVNLKNTKIITKDETLSFDLEAKNFHYHESVDVERLLLDFHSFSVTTRLSAKMSENSLLATLNYKLFAPAYEIGVNQTIFYKDEKYKTQIDARLIKHPLSLAFETLSVTADGDATSLDSEIKAGKFVARLSSKGFKKFSVGLKSPEFNMDAQLQLKKEEILLKVQANKNLLNATLRKKGEKLSGSGTLGSAKFTLQGELDKKAIRVQTKIASLKKLLEELKVTNKEDKTYQEAKVDINSTINYEGKFAIANSLFIPSLFLKTDEQTTQRVKNVTLFALYKDKKITIEKYTAEFMEQKFYANKKSTILIDEKNNLLVKEFWIYNNLLVTGKIKPAQKSAKLLMSSDKFDYVSKDVNMSLQANLQASFDANGTQTIDGNVTILDALASYVPIKDYKITDKDIIIVQDMKKEKSSKLSLRLNVNSAKPLEYKTKEVNAKFIPEILLTQEPNKPLKLLGKVTIVDGSLNASDKEFKIDESYLYFEGTDELNPKLNLHLHYYTLDYIDIEIFITNTLSEPVVIFSSKPAMSQNDIMSYILFGERANAIFESSGNKTSINTILLGTGLNQMFSNVSGVNVDTLNILDNKDGTLGYEVGARFNKNFRVVYKNDTSSSVVLQYSVSKSIRFDIDSHESGQGVAFTYVKDFSIR